jgi:hypothetical protein
MIRGFQDFFKDGVTKSINRYVFKYASTPLSMTYVNRKSLHRKLIRLCQVVDPAFHLQL